MTLVQLGMDEQGLGAHPAQHQRTGEGRSPVREVHHELRVTTGERATVDELEQSLDVVLLGPGREVELADVVMEGPAEILAVIGPLQLALGAGAHVHPPLVEELDLHGRRVAGGRTDREAPGCPGGPGVEPGDRRRDQLHVVAVHGGPVDAGHHGPLHDPRRTSHVATGDHGRSLGHHAGVGRGQPKGALGGQVHVEQAGDATLPEQASRPAGLPDDRLGDDCAGVHRLVWVYLDLRVEHGSFADVAFVRHHHAFLDPRPELHVGVLAHHAASERDRGSHVHVVVHDAAMEERP